MPPGAPPPAPASPPQRLALVLALACLLVALILALVLALRSGPAADPSRPGAANPQGDGAGAPAPPSPPAPPDGAPRVATYPDTEGLQGTARLDGAQALHAAADPGSPVVARAPGGAAVELRGGRPGWTLVAWAAAGGQVHVGWVALDPMEARARVARGQVRGAARFEGAPPAMPVPEARAGAAFCKGKPVPLEEVSVREGMLRDVLVQLKGVALRGADAPPRERAVIRQVDCMYRPLVTGVVAGEEIQIDNGDPTLHNVHSYQDRATVWNLAQQKGGAPIVRAMDTPGTVQLRCDVHPWMKAFVVVTDHPFFAVTGEDGRFTIDFVPAGRYAIEAWHPRLGRKRASVVVTEAGADAAFVYHPEDDAPEDDAPPE